MARVFLMDKWSGVWVGGNSVGHGGGRACTVRAVVGLNTYLPYLLSSLSKVSLLEKGRGRRAKGACLIANSFAFMGS